MRRAVERAGRRGVHRRQRRRGVRRGRRRPRRARHRLRGDREPGRAAAAPARLGGDLGRGDRRVRLAGAAQGVAARPGRPGARRSSSRSPSPTRGPTPTASPPPPPATATDGCCAAPSTTSPGSTRPTALLVVARSGRDAGRRRRSCRCSSCPPTRRASSAPRCRSTSCCRTSSSCSTSTTCGVPAEALVGDEGAGFRQVFHGLNPERITGAALGVGVARYALRRAAEYATTTAACGTRPIGAHQGVAHPLAQAKIETELAALMTHKAAWLHDHGLPAGEAANMAKYAAAEAALHAVDVAIQSHGGNGVASEYGLLPYWGLARLLRIAPVNREMILNYVAQHSLGLPQELLMHRTSSTASTSATRSPARPRPARQARGRRRRPPPHLRRARRVGQPHRARPRPRGLAPRRRARPGLGQQRRVPRRLLRLREARRRLRADQPGLAARRGGLRARPLAGQGSRRRDASWSPRWATPCARPPASPR